MEYIVLRYAQDENGGDGTILELRSRLGKPSWRSIERGVKRRRRGDSSR